MENPNIVINFSGWISVAKEDLKIQDTTNIENVDTTNLTSQEVVDMLKDGRAILESFGNTYLNEAIDGEDNLTFEVEEEF
jgi:hypothetical protein